MKKKTCRVNHNQNNYTNIIIFGTKYELFIAPYDNTFFLAFGQAKIILHEHCYLHILWQKNLLTIFHTE